MPVAPKTWQPSRFLNSALAGASVNVKDSAIKPTPSSVLRQKKPLNRQEAERGTAEQAADPRKSGLQLTLRWREMDSNFRFRAKGATDLSFRFCLCP
jgi:hypothetical protein